MGGRVAVIASGSESTANASCQRVIEQVFRLIDTSGGTLSIDPRNRSLAEQLPLNRQHQCDIIVAIGGDGTANAAAELAMRRDVPLFIVPMGTMNLVAKDLGLPIDPDAVVRASPDLVTTTIDCGMANESIFLHSALLGMVPNVAEHREQLRHEPDLLGKLGHVPDLASTTLNAPMMTFLLQTEGGSVVQPTRSLVVSNNPLARQSSVPHARSSLTSGTLGVYASVHEGPLASVKLIASLGLGHLPDDPETLDARCSELIVDTEESDTLRVSLDGEVHEFATPIRLSIRPRALRVAIPAEFAPGASA